MERERPAVMACERCGGDGWVCEAHPDRPWPHDDCSGPGIPFPACQIPGARPELPDNWRSVTNTQEPESVRDMNDDPRDGVPVSEQLRRAVQDWLEKKGVKGERKRAVTRKRS